MLSKQETLMKKKAYFDGKVTGLSIRVWMTVGEQVEVYLSPVSEIFLANRFIQRRYIVKYTIHNT